MKKNENWVTGIHAVSAILKQRPTDIQRLLANPDRSDKRLDSLRELARTNGVVIEELNSEAIAMMNAEVHQGVAAQLRQTRSMLSEKELFAALDKLDHDPLVLALDGVTDPHNLGACLRTADAAGVDAVVIPKDKAVGLNATVSRVASGAAETVNLASVTNLVRCLQAFKERKFWVAGTDDEAQTSIHEQDLKGALVLVMGSEGKGLRRLTREHCDFLVSIPMAGALSSLNVSVATGVALFEAVRQRR